MIGSIKVPNHIPVLPFNNIAIIGEYCGDDDVVMETPLVGASGNLLRQLLQKHNINKDACYLGNCVQYKPKYKGGVPNDHPAHQEGSIQLSRDIKKLDPNLVILMGDLPIKLAGKGHMTARDLRGTLFICNDEQSPFYERKCLATIHPTNVLRKYNDLPLLNSDLTKASEEQDTKTLELPQRSFDLDLTPDEICKKLYNWPLGELGYFDIEGGCKETHGGITCVSFAPSPEYGFIVDFKNMVDVHKPKVYDAFKWWCENPDIPKICQGALYEMFVIPWVLGIEVRGLVGDTMVSGYEIYAELEKKLGVQGSIWTREPAWKHERTIVDDRTHHKYCCKDSCVGREIYDRHMEYFEDNPEAKQHYELNIEVTKVLAYVQLKGFRYDHSKAEELRNSVRVKQEEHQARLDARLPSPLNVNSHVQMKKLLYEHYNLPKQYNGRGKTRKLTNDTKALLTLLRDYGDEPGDTLLDCLHWKKQESIRKQLDCSFNEDGRIRGAYNCVGTETGRFASYSSNSGSGYNLQTVMPEVRHLFIADPGKYIAKIDLDGADGWTVACHCLALGDDTMFNDLSSGIKPAKVICASYLLEDPNIVKMDQDELKVICDQLDLKGKNKWLYAAAKMVLYGSFYGMQEKTMSMNILEQSWKKQSDPIYVLPSVCLTLQHQHLFRRYWGIEEWQDKIKETLETTGELPSASGHTRRFFNRLTDQATLRSALSHEPQINTTYACSLAASRLQNDLNNRNPDGSFKIEPLHQVHDELVVQFNSHHLEKCKTQFLEYFNNRMTIAGIDLVIPYSGGVGHYWEDSSICKL